MPEILEVEFFRRAAATTIGRTIREVRAADRLVVVDRGIADALVGRRVRDVTRRGKTMTLHVGSKVDDVAIDVHFGMSGRIVVDDASPIGELAYGASDDSRWIRFALTFGRGHLKVSDPRRFARVSWSKRGAGLGPDALEVTRDEFLAVLESRRGPVKAVLLDQSVIAGLGNMLVDEMLWRQGVDPRRPLTTLSRAERVVMHRTMRTVLGQLERRGGSHAGDLSVDHRNPSARCPRDGAELARCVVGGRTTYWCPRHQV